MKKLDKILTIILVVAYVPLGLWGWSQHSPHMYHRLLSPIMFYLGVIYLIFESIRLKSPLLAMCLGILVASVLMGPPLILHTEHLWGFVALLITLPLAGLLLSSIALLMQRYKAGVWISLFAISIICFAVAILGGINWYNLNLAYFVGRPDASDLERLFDSVSWSNRVAEDISFAIFQIVVSSLLGIVAFLVGMVLKRKYPIESPSEKLRKYLTSLKNMLRNNVTNLSIEDLLVMYYDGGLTSAAIKQLEEELDSRGTRIPVYIQGNANNLTPLEFNDASVDKSKNILSSHKSPEELYDDAFQHFSAKNDKELKEICFRLWIEHPNSRQIKWALKRFKLTKAELIHWVLNNRRGNA